MLKEKHKTILTQHAHAKLHKTMHVSQRFFHCAYLAAVSIEAHGMYGKAALGLLVIVVIGFITGDSEAEG